MKGYKRRQNHNSGKAQRITERREAIRQELELRRKSYVEELKAEIERLDKHPNTICEFMGGYISTAFLKNVLEKALIEFDKR